MNIESIGFPFGRVVQASEDDYRVSQACGRGFAGFRRACVSERLGEGERKGLTGCNDFGRAKSSMEEGKAGTRG